MQRNHYSCCWDKGYIYIFFKNCSNVMKLILRVFKDCLCYQLLCIITSHKVFTVSLPGVIDDNICTNYGCYWLSTGIYWVVEVHRRRGEAEPSLDFNNPTFSSQLKPHMYYLVFSTYLYFAHTQIHILVPFAPIRFCPAMSYV